MKDEELQTLLRKRGYRVLELVYDRYSDKKRDQLYKEIIGSLGSTVNILSAKATEGQFAS